MSVVLPNRPQGRFSLEVVISVCLSAHVKLFLGSSQKFLYVIYELLFILLSKAGQDLLLVLICNRCK